MKTVKIGTRGSKLALAQAEIAKELIETKFGYKVRIEIISSLGDRDQVSQLHNFRGMGVFTGSIERELRERRIDIAVHSLKDLPIENSVGLYLPALLKRDTPNDVLIIKESALINDDPLEVKKGIRVATGSPRRQSQFLALEPTSIPIDIRGNVNTRISRLDTGFIDALIMAGAVFDRINIELPEGVRLVTLPNESFPCAPGQGAIALQARENEYAEVKLLNHEDTSNAVLAERYVLERIGGGCDISFGLHITKENNIWKGYASVAPENWNPSQPAILSRTIVESKTTYEIVQKILVMYSNMSRWDTTNGIDKMELRKIIIARDKVDTINYSEKIGKSLNAVIASIPIFDYETNYSMINDKKLITSWKNCSWVVLTSQRSVEFLYLLSSLQKRNPIRIAAVGPQTANKLRSAGFPVHLVSAGSLSDLKKTLTEAREIYPGEVLFLHGSVITGYPSDDAQSYQVYQTSEKRIDLPFKPDDLIVFSKKSAETIIKSLGKGCTKRWIAIGETTGSYLRSKGINVVIAPKPTPQGVVQALLK
ncbi:MAG: hydroxymethylbilane synthase [Candidatus Heimdallarchaeota archaeon]|nr:hydroxymethylbilane synthase [Candidatus Heimdallarchaeota archaeon]